MPSLAKPSEAFKELRSSHPFADARERNKTKSQRAFVKDSLFVDEHSLIDIVSLKRKFQISIVFFVGITILLVTFLIYPLFSEIKKISQDSLSQKEELLALEKKFENLEKFKIIFPEISGDLEKINNLFVDKEVPVDFIRFLEKISRDCQVFLKISVGGALKSEKDPWPSISFQLSLAGSFPNLAQFLEKLESCIYLIEIQNLNISRLTETELKSKEFEKFSLGDVKANLSIKVYTRQ